MSDPQTPMRLMRRHTSPRRSSGGGTSRNSICPGRVITACLIGSPAARHPCSCPAGISRKYQPGGDWRQAAFSRAPAFSVADDGARRPALAPTLSVPVQSVFFVLFPVLFRVFRVLAARLQNDVAKDKAELT